MISIKELMCLNEKERIKLQKGIIKNLVIGAWAPREPEIMKRVLDALNSKKQISRSLTAKILDRIFSIGMYTQVVTYHEVTEFINSMPDSFRIACGPCACRINTAEELGPDAMDIEAGKFEFIKQTPLNVDIQFGVCGEQFGELESYKDITKRELLELEKECHNLGLVANIYVMLNGEGSICHCSSKTCVPLTANNCISGKGHFIKQGELVAKTNPTLCNNTGYCIKVCHFNARRMINENGRMILQYDRVKCYGCGLCESVCPEKAVKMISRKERVGQTESSRKQG